ncbi:MAG: hypothetical protein AB7H80_01400 [Candidatus Kapaibacterium sp.]
MNERRWQDYRLSRPFRAEDAKSKCYPWGAAVGFPHGHTAVLPAGATR